MINRWFTARPEWFYCTVVGIPSKYLVISHFWLQTRVNHVPWRFWHSCLSFRLFTFPLFWGNFKWRFDVILLGQLSAPRLWPALLWFVNVFKRLYSIDEVLCREEVLYLSGSKLISVLSIQNTAIGFLRGLTTTNYLTVYHQLQRFETFANRSVNVPSATSLRRTSCLSYSKVLWMIVQMPRVLWSDVCSMSYIYSPAVHHLNIFATK